MAKKNGSLEKIEDVPVGASGIDSQIDMKLSKQDLIDMCLEDARTNLEEQVRKGLEVVAAEKRALDKAVLAAEGTLFEIVKKENPAEFAILEQFGGVGDKQVGHGVLLTSDGVFTEEEISRMEYDERRRLCDDRSQVYHLPCSIRISNKDPLDRHHRNKTKAVEASISFRFNVDEKTLKKLFAPLEKQGAQYFAMRKHLESLQLQLKGVDKTGKKAKAQLIRRILEGSEGGKAILSNMGLIKSSVQTLLIESSKSTQARNED